MCIDVMSDFSGVILRRVVFGMWTDVGVIAVMIVLELIADALYTVKALGDAIFGGAGIGAEVKAGDLRDMIDT